MLSIWSADQSQRVDVSPAAPFSSEGKTYIQLVVNNATVALLERKMQADKGCYSAPALEHFLRL
jgi:hypothetical protein